MRPDEPLRRAEAPVHLLVPLQLAADREDLRAEGGAQDQEEGDGESQREDHRDAGEAGQETSLHEHAVQVSSVTNYFW